MFLPLHVCKFRNTYTLVYIVECLKFNSSYNIYQLKAAIPVLFLDISSYVKSLDSDLL